MLSDLADRLGGVLRGIFGDTVKTVIYGSPDMIPTTAQPAVVYNAQSVGRVPTGATQGVINVTYSLAGVTSVMADSASAAAAAQELLWGYDSGKDVGIYPALLTKRNKILLHDALDRAWVLSDVGSADFQGYDTGRNVLGVVSLSITIQTLIKF